MKSDFGEDVGNVGFVEGSEAEAFAAEIFQGGANKVKFFVVDDQKAVVECHARLD